MATKKQNLLITEAKFLIKQKENKIKQLKDEIYYLNLLVFRDTRMKAIKAQKFRVISRKAHKSKLKAAIGGVRATEG